MRLLLIAGFGFLLSAVYLGVRIAGLEQRVSALRGQLGTPAGAARGAGEAAPSATPKSGESQVERIDKLEAAVRELEERDRTLAAQAKATPGHGAAEGSPAADDKILEVVNREQQRVLDQQLQYHRARWMEGREAGIKYFTQHYALNAHQSGELKRLLNDEADQLVGLMKKPHAFENPDQLARDWLAALARTDAAAKGLLDPTQQAAWTQARLTERFTLWPWLPVEPAKN